MPFADTSLGYFELSFGHSAVFGDIGGDGYGQKQLSQHPASLQSPSLFAGLPAFVKLPCVKITEENLLRLREEGALTLPPPTIQNALLQSYAEYVHPLVPLLELYDFLAIINDQSGLNGQVSLLLYQAVMFAATAFVDTIILTQAGYSTGKAARKAFFRRARVSSAVLGMSLALKPCWYPVHLLNVMWQLLYDINYESDSLVTLQALLLMTYWDDSPNDVEDSWHWMGVAVKLAHTIGLHRNSTMVRMSSLEKQLRKRIWWSCFMRDRLIALGMRRPTRIKDGDFDVPMLERSDFDSRVLPESTTVIPAECTLLRDIPMQKKLVDLCISRARLCICIGRVLEAQYSVIVSGKTYPEDITNCMVPIPPKVDADNLKSVDSAYRGLVSWAMTLSPTCQYRPLTPSEVNNGHSTVVFQRTLLHMIYFATLSALHRSQASCPYPVVGASAITGQLQDDPRWRVRHAAMKITDMASELRQLRLERYLATICVTVLLPAAVIHLLDMSSPEACFRELAAHSFLRCMDVMEKLHDVDAASEHASGFLCAFVRKFFTGSSFQPDTNMRLGILLANSTGLSKTTRNAESGLQGKDGRLAQTSLLESPIDEHQSLPPISRTKFQRQIPGLISPHAATGANHASSANNFHAKDSNALIAQTCRGMDEGQQAGLH
ncbi:hypothetical protein Brms1b_008145 [Colletotrichum noveboracense]|nr:hypothetical protein Brms1b_008145 [Colletotrichum noveboracense]